MKEQNNFESNLIDLFQSLELASQKYPKHNNFRLSLIRLMRKIEDLTNDENYTDQEKNEQYLIIKNEYNDLMCIDLQYTINSFSDEIIRRRRQNPDF